MNKRLFLKMSLVTLPILALFSQPVLAEENIHFSSCKEAWANGYSDLHEENLVILPSWTAIMMAWLAN